MRAERQVQETVIVDDFLADRHRWQADIGLLRNNAGWCAGAAGEQWQIVITVADPAERLGCPQRFATSKAKRAEGVSIGQPFQDARSKPCA